MPPNECLQLDHSSDRSHIAANVIQAVIYRNDLGLLNIGILHAGTAQQIHVAIIIRPDALAITHLSIGVNKIFIRY